MDCKAAEKLIPDFIQGRMETRTAKHFLAHVNRGQPQMALCDRYGG